MSSSFTKEYVLGLVGESDAALARAILALAARQTADEHAGEQTRVSNGRGFNQLDAPFLTSIAKALPKWNNHMTPRQIAKARPMVRKYWRQLIEIAEENAGRCRQPAQVSQEQHPRGVRSLRVASSHLTQPKRFRATLDHQQFTRSKSR